ncbi:MAG: PHP domain-containing protein, partial [Acidimicrobiales bacterium]
MGWNNPPIPWSELERRLSDRPRNADAGCVPERNGGDSPAWGPKRGPYQVPPGCVPERRGVPLGRSVLPYAELHCHSAFSFLDGASPPEELAEVAVRLGLEALAVTDHDGFYGVVRFAEAASALGLPTVFGSELTLDLHDVRARSRPRPQAGLADPEGAHLVVLARDPAGYGRLARSISAAHLAAGEKGLPKCSLGDLVEAHGGHWLVLTGCRKGTVPAALAGQGPSAAAWELGRLVDAFGRDNVAVEVWDHGDPIDSVRNDALVALAARAGVEVVATNNVHYAVPSRRPLATALAAVRSRRSLDEVEG